MKNIFFILIIVIFIPIISIISAQPKPIVIQVNSKTMATLSSWDKEIVFLTPANNPIRDLNDITKRQGEVGMWGGELFVNVLKFLKVSGLKIYNPDSYFCYTIKNYR